jgi:hypothetical protein
MESFIRCAVFLGSVYIDYSGGCLVLGECIYGVVLECQDRFRPWRRSATDVHHIELWGCVPGLGDGDGRANIRVFGDLIVISRINIGRPGVFRVVVRYELVGRVNVVELKPGPRIQRNRGDMEAVVDVNLGCSRGRWGCACSLLRLACSLFRLACSLLGGGMVGRGES